MIRHTSGERRLQSREVWIAPILRADIDKLDARLNDIAVGHFARPTRRDENRLVEETMEVRTALDSGDTFAGRLKELRPHTVEELLGQIARCGIKRGPLLGRSGIVSQRLGQARCNPEVLTGAYDDDMEIGVGNRGCRNPGIRSSGPADLRRNCERSVGSQLNHALGPSNPLIQYNLCPSIVRNIVIFRDTFHRPSLETEPGVAAWIVIDRVFLVSHAVESRRARRIGIVPSVKAVGRAASDRALGGLQPAVELQLASQARSPIASTVG